MSYGDRLVVRFDLKILRFAVRNNVFCTNGPQDDAVVVFTAGFRHQLFSKPNYFSFSFVFVFFHNPRAQSTQINDGQSRDPKYTMRTQREILTRVIFGTTILAGYVVTVIRII